MAAILQDVAQQFVEQSEDYVLQVVPRRIDWGRSRIGKLWVTYFQDPWDIIALSRSADVLIIATAGLPAYIVTSVVRGGRRSASPFVMLLDPLFPKVHYFDPLIRRALRRVGSIICIRRGDILTLANRFGVPAARCRFAYMPAPDIRDTETFTEDYFYAAGDSFRDWPILFAALRQVPYRCVVASSTATRSYPPDLLHIELHPAITADEGRTYMRRARAVVVPLQATEMACGPTIILDALALGKAVIASSTNGSADYIEHGSSGLLYDPGDVEGLVDILRKVIADDELVNRLGNTGATIARQKFNLQAFKEVLGETLAAVGNNRHY